jgi:hypothetical protein
VASNWDRTIPDDTHDLFNDRPEEGRDGFHSEASGFFAEDERR